MWDREVVGLLGRNGVGKSTTLKTIMGLLRASGGTLTFEGRDLVGLPTHRLPALGIGYVPEDRRVFRLLTVLENLRTGLDRAGMTPARRQALLEKVYRYFPVLRERRNQAGGTLSGGEQQMLAIGRSLMSKPKLMMLDEPSLGLAPLLVEEIFGRVKSLNDEIGTTVLLVEQNARRALEIADHAYVMENGRIVLEGPAAELASNPDVQEFYLGLSEGGARKSYRDVKHYKRRKRWL